MNEGPGSDTSSSGPRGREELGYRSRLERRTAKREAHRREVKAKMWRAIVPAVVVIAAVVVVLVVFGGGGGDEDVAQGTATTEMAEPAGGSALLVIEQQGGVPEVILMQPTARGGVVMAIPGITLLRAPAGFKTVAELHASGDDAVLRSALGEALGVLVGPAASVAWSDLRGAMQAAGITGVPAETLDSEGTQALSVAEAVLAFLSTTDAGAAAEKWESLPLGGDVSGLRAAVSENKAALFAGWTSAGLMGTVVRGADFVYLDSDVGQARALLAGITREAAVKVAVQNGSGALGVAEAAAGILGSLGYALLPVSNSEDFPDVVVSRITVGPGLFDDGEQIRTALGVGEVTEDPDLDSDTIVVVLGADFVPPTTSASEASE